jgi:hypothetical protein
MAQGRPIDLSLYFEGFTYVFLINDRITWNDIFIITSNHNVKGLLVMCQCRYSYESFSIYLFLLLIPTSLLALALLRHINDEPGNLFYQVHHTLILRQITQTEAWTLKSHQPRITKYISIPVLQWYVNTVISQARKLSLSDSKNFWKHCAHSSLRLKSGDH